MHIEKQIKCQYTSRRKHIMYFNVINSEIDALQVVELISSQINAKVVYMIEKIISENSSLRFVSASTY